MFCATLALSKARGWTLALNEEVAKVQPHAAEGEVEGRGRTWRIQCSRWYLQLPQNLAMKCLTVNYRSCFGGAKASLKLFCFRSFTQTQGSFVWPLPITGTTRREKLFGTLSFCPQLFHSALPDCQDPSLCGSALLSGTTAPEGPGRPHELQGQAKFCSLWSPLSPAQQSLVTCHMERKI